MNSKSDATYTSTYLLMREQRLRFMLLLAESEHAEKDPLEIKFRKDIVESYKPIGESLFTLFASLTYAYHYLMTLIK